MSALAAVLSFGRDDAAARADRLLALQSARAPDGPERWSQGPVALGLGRLGQVALAVRRSPRGDIDACLAWDGRIDNRDTLMAALPTATDPAMSDQDLALAAWVQWGEGMPERLLGDFAFALWDRNEQALFCARDPVGARPCYYTWQDGFFALASEDEALAALPEVRHTWNRDRLFYRDNGGFWAFDWQQSWRDEVEILLPGRCLRITAGRRLRRRVFFDWGAPPAPFRGDAGEAAEAFGRLLRRAVADRLRGVAVAGVIASGGIDSLSVLAAAAAEADTRPLHQFSLVASDPAPDDLESRSILAAAEHFATVRHFLHLPALTGCLDPDEVRTICQQRHPVEDSIWVIALMCRAAARAGVRSLLHGASGDCLLYAPDEYLCDLLWARDAAGWRGVWGEARAASRNHAYLQGVWPVRLLMRACLRRYTPPWMRHLWRLRRRHPYTPVREALWEGETPDAQLRRYTRRHRLQVLREERAAWRDADADYLQQIAPIGLVRGLEGYERVAGRYGVMLADPLSDLRLVQFVRSLAPWLRTRDGWTKAPARAWARSCGLPDFAVQRSDKPHLGGWLAERLHLPGGDPASLVGPIDDLGIKQR